MKFENERARSSISKIWDSAPQLLLPNLKVKITESNWTTGSKPSNEIRAIFKLMIANSHYL